MGKIAMRPLCRLTLALLLAGVWETGHSQDGAAALVAPGAVRAEDVDNDSGDSIRVVWEEAVDERVATYEAFWASSREAIHSEAANEEEHDDSNRFWQSLGNVARGEELMAIFRRAKPGTVYFFKVVGRSAEGSVDSEIASGQSMAQWFDKEKLWIFIFGVVICSFVIYFISAAKRGRELFVRKIAGLEAVDEAVGRATEMGRPIVFVPGILDMDNVQTLAGLTMLGYVSKTIAEYDAQLDVPVSRSLVMTTGREIVKQSYLEAGRPDAFNEDMVYYVTDEQFGYVAGVNGKLLRDQPATCFYMGAFFAESLLLAETGNRIGAIQIAGTAMPAQLPFFVAACDYTLIGEELFAASAYLSGDPKQLGSLKGQDVGKIIVMITLLLGSAGATVAELTGFEPFQRVVEFLTTRMFA